MLFNPHKVLRIHKWLRHVPGSKLVGRLLDQPYQQAVERAVNIADLRRIAKRRSHKMIFDYLDGGADDEITLRRNKDAYTQLELHYKILAGNQPQTLDTSIELFGQTLAIPFFNCPTAGNRMFHLEGEQAVVKAALQHETLYCMSSLSTTSMSQIHEISTPRVPKLFQLYVWKDRQLVRDLLQEAKAHGFTSLALTVDASWMGNRERDARNQFTIPPNYSLTQTVEAFKSPAWTFDFLSNEPYAYACIDPGVPAESLANFINQQLTPDFSWRDAEWLLGEWSTPNTTALKGVIRPDDATRAQQIGFDAIWISNHGGRQMETAPATIDVLPAIRRAVGSKMPVILDGGIQRGTDIVKAIGLGATAVGIGKPYLWGLTAGGTNGVVKAYQILREELQRAMGLLGVASIPELQQLGPTTLVQQRNKSTRDYPDRYATERGYGGGIT